jgi:RNA polymerase sigma-B factor
MVVSIKGGFEMHRLARSPHAESGPAPIAGSARRRAEDERRLLVAYRLNRDCDARNELVRRLLPVAELLARRYAHGAEAHEDLVQVASLGALKAIDRFELGRDTTLASYALPMMDGEIRHHLRDNVGLVHVPRRLGARARMVANASGELAPGLGHPPSPKEIAGSVGLEVEEVHEANRASAAARVLPLEAFARDDHGEALSYLDTIGAEDRRYDSVEVGATLAASWRSLDPRTRASVYLRFVEDRTYAEIADRVDLSPTHVARLIGDAVARLRFVARRAGVAPLM